MARTLSSRRSLVSRPRRKRIWARTNFGMTVPITGDPVTVLPLASFETNYSAQLIGATIMRIRGELLAINAAPAPAAGVVETHRLTVGFLVGNAELAASPAANQPDPDDFASSAGSTADWMGYEVFTLARSGGAPAPDTDSEPWWQRKTFDIRAARRLDELGDTLIAFGVTNSASTASLITGSLSVLVLLP